MRYTGFFPYCLLPIVYCLLPAPCSLLPKTQKFVPHQTAIVTFPVFCQSPKVNPKPIENRNR
ncbi:MAG: hypothetical protein F6J90_09580 [Moorea sp. SIOASIH]|uniref:hypothetical protein n=1 Tax=Moorena sp. SIOASIH TaxID=2607817 RepID=UPI0013B9A734|nr:hypothetical protein [Moorena sp. SIOASIH]NEO36559.1 hypothetical protein [Moorena sp. SIOASIH]